MDTTYDPTYGSTAPTSGDDAMAIGFFTRAAEAIRLAPKLTAELASVNARFADLDTARATLEDIRRTQDETIATLRAQVESLREAEATRTAELIDARETIAARQADIDLLDKTVAGLEHDYDEVTNERDDALAKSALQAEALTSVITTLNAVNAALGRPNLDPDPREEIERACAKPEPAPEWDHASTVPGFAPDGAYPEDDIPF